MYTDDHVVFFMGKDPNKFSTREGGLKCRSWARLWGRVYDMHDDLASIYLTRIARLASFDEVSRDIIECVTSKNLIVSLLWFTFSPNLRDFKLYCLEGLVPRVLYDTPWTYLIRCTSWMRHFISFII